MLRLILSLSLLFPFTSAVLSDEADSRWYSQKPSIADSQVAENDEPSRPESPPSKPSGVDLTQGPQANWIWETKRASGSERVVFRKTFSLDAPANAASLIATCDNRLTVWINGQRALQGDSWETAAKTEVTPKLKLGENMLLVEGANAGGPAGMALKLSIELNSGKRVDVVSDSDWETAPSKDDADWSAARVIGKMGVGPWGDVFANPRETLLSKTPRGVFNLLPGFQVERLFTVPKDELGSWVCIAFDGSGRLLASDQGGKGLCRVTPPPIGDDSQPTKVERLNVPITAAQGMLHAFGSLYLSVNGGPGSGLYRARDTNGDDQYDELTKLKEFRGGGEHGPHALRLSPDGKSLYVIAGNHTELPKGFDASRVPTNWGEDLLLPRQWDARGHARGRLAPGGWICRTDPDGKHFEIVSIGYRNPYDMDFNDDGELFAYDADMEWDLGAPWYRPTRVVHAVSGSEFGWRSGAGKWPTYYLDSLPQVLNIGPGSPVGVTFGRGARFPAKYQKALFLLDWTFGTMYAVHLTPDGASYRGKKEEFLSRSPLPLTDAAVGPDGALYFTVGGRGTQSELFRVTYVGKESTAPAVDRDQKFAKLRELRRRLQSHHAADSCTDDELAFVWTNLGHADRHIRFAARTALERQDVKRWVESLQNETDEQTLVGAVAALARQGEPSHRPAALAALAQVEPLSANVPLTLELLRAYQLTFIRLGRPDPPASDAVERRLDAMYPSQDDRINRELCRLLVYLKSPKVVTKTLALMARPDKQPSVEMSELLARNGGYGGTIAKMLNNQPDADKLHFAYVLRNVRYGWTLAQRREYFAWFEEARQRSGGASYQGFLENIRNDALATLSPFEEKALQSSELAPPPRPAELPKPQGPGHAWTVTELAGLAGKLTGRDFESGRRAYAASRCVVCHRFGGEGGATGPDLTNAASRFSVKDLSEALIEPSKVISDQYRAATFQMLDGRVITGRVASEQDNVLTVLTDPEDARKATALKREEIEEMAPSKISLMPNGLLDVLNEQEALDLLAYLMSRGDPEDPMFK